VARRNEERNATRALDGANVGLVVTVDDDIGTRSGCAITGDANDRSHTHSPRNQHAASCVARQSIWQLFHNYLYERMIRYDYWSPGSVNGDAEETGLPVVRREMV